MVKRPVHLHGFSPPLQGNVARDLTQAKAWAMLSWPFGPQNHRGAWGFPSLTGSLTARRAKKTQPRALAWVNIKRRLVL